MAVSFDDIKGERFQEDLRQAAGFKPLMQGDLERAYKRFEDVGVRMGRVRGKTDSQLYKQATDDVLAWWKKQKADEAERVAAAQRAEAERVAAAARQQEEIRRQQAAAARQAASTAARSGGANYTGGMLPDTAAGNDAPSAEQVRVLQRPSPDYVQQQIARYNLWGARPPAYALTTVGAFDQWVRSAVQWVERQKSQQQRTIASNRRPVIR